MVKLQKQAGIMAAAAVLLAAGLMTARFAVGERSYTALAALPASLSGAGEGHAAAEGQININTASAEELDTLTGIGEVKAAAIVAWREEHGPFRYPEELILVSGIGEGTLANILDQITTGGE